MNEAVRHFQLSGAPVSCAPYGNGHINETHLVACADGARYILQKINTKVFTDPDGLIDNIRRVTEYLRAMDADPRHSLRLVPALDGKLLWRAEDGSCYRVYDFVTDSLTLERAETEADFRESAAGFGMFQNQLADFPADTLRETIAHFHDTPDRYRQLHEAIDRDSMGRAAEMRPEIEFALAREADAGEMTGMLARGELPLRVTHNDTKLNNVLFDAATRKAMCVIDLDTVMPGLAGNDFGDSIRFGASTAAEDEIDLDKVSMSLKLFEAYAEGFLGACGSRLTRAEKETLPTGAKLMTLECGIRFLADYLNGDTYFHIHRPRHNVDRCRTQFKLVRDMERKADEMRAIVLAR